MQETWVWSLVWEDPTSWGATTKPRCQTTEAPAPNACAPQRREAATRRNWGVCTQQHRPRAAKNTWIKLKKTTIYPTQPPFVSVLNQKLPWMSNNYLLKTKAEVFPPSSSPRITRQWNLCPIKYLFLRLVMLDSAFSSSLSRAPFPRFFLSSLGLSSHSQLPCYISVLYR